MDSQDTFRKRLHSLPTEFVKRKNYILPPLDKRSLSESALMDGICTQEWSCNDKFKQYDSDSRSLDQDQCEDLVDNFIDVIYLGDLFDENSLNMNNGGAIDIQQNEFDEGDIDEVEVASIVRQKTRNKLYEIFVKACPNPNKLRNFTRRRTLSTVSTLGTPAKRKLSFGYDMDQDRSPEILPQLLDKEISKQPPKKKKKRNKNVTVQPGQQLLSQMWGRKKDKQPQSVKNLPDDERDPPVEV